MSLQDVKVAAADIKKLRPVQAAVMAFFQVKTWKEIATVLGDAVSAERLSGYTVCSLWLSSNTQIM